jgi:hypothetical protein
VAVRIGGIELDAPLEALYGLFEIGHSARGIAEALDSQVKIRFAQLIENQSVRGTKPVRFFEQGDSLSGVLILSGPIIVMKAQVNTDAQRAQSQKKDEEDDFFQGVHFFPEGVALRLK